MERPVDSFKEYVTEDVLGHIDGITSRRMFGGYGLYLDGIIFGIITGESRLYFKVDDTNKPEFLERDSEPFTFTSHHGTKQVSLSYYNLPEEIMEDKGEVETWVRKSAAISQNGKTRHPRKKGR